MIFASDRILGTCIVNTTDMFIRSPSMTIVSADGYMMKRTGRG
jgi:hypothetical protein